MRQYCRDAEDTEYVYELVDSQLIDPSASQTHLAIIMGIMMALDWLMDGKQPSNLGQSKGTNPIEKALSILHHGPQEGEAVIFTEILRSSDYTLGSAWEEFLRNKREESRED